MGPRYPVAGCPSGGDSGRGSRGLARLKPPIQGVRGRGQRWFRKSSGGGSGLKVAGGGSCNWCKYQLVVASDNTRTLTSRRTPSTSCAYHSGNVSLSPAVTTSAYGSTERSTSRA